MSSLRAAKQVSHLNPVEPLKGRSTPLSALSRTQQAKSLRTKFFPRFKELRSVASASWGPSKESLSQLHKAFIRPDLSYASPGWYPFFCDTLKKNLEVYHRSARRVISCCLSSTPVPLLLVESLTLPLEITLNHQALAFYEWALRLPADNFPPTTSS